MGYLLQKYFMPLTSRSEGTGNRRAKASGYKCHPTLGGIKGTHTRGMGAAEFRKLRDSEPPPSWRGGKAPFYMKP